MHGVLKAGAWCCSCCCVAVVPRLYRPVLIASTADSRQTTVRCLCCVCAVAVFFDAATPESRTPAAALLLMTPQHAARPRLPTIDRSALRPA